MKTIFLTILFLLGVGSILGAVESQIILINSEAYLVDLDENFDVVNVYEKIPEYFSDKSSHEEILAAHLSVSKNESIGVNTIDEGTKYDLPSEDIGIWEYSSDQSKYSTIGLDCEAISLSQNIGNQVFVTYFNDFYQYFDEQAIFADSHKFFSFAKSNPDDLLSFLI